MYNRLSKLSATFLLTTFTSLAAAQALPQGTRVQKDIAYASQNGKSIKLDIYFPPNSDATPNPAILRFSPKRESPAGAAASLLNAHFTLVYAAYLPDDDTLASTRAFSQFPNDLFAAKAAVRYLRGNAASLHLDKNRIAAWGAGPGASIAALLAMTPNQKDLGGSLGDFPNESPVVSALCLFEGITDWRNAELYGDETVNTPGSPAYQLFGGNPKEHPDDARAASAVDYITPDSPATLMVTLAGDQQRAMHRIFAQTLKSAGVRSALYEQASTAGLASHSVDEPATSRTVLEFFSDVLGPDHAATPSTPPDLNHEIDQLASAGLYAQARRLINEQIGTLTGTTTEVSQRSPWLKKLRALSDQQETPALKELQTARRKAAGAIQAPAGWTLREVLTDPERIGHYIVEPTISQHDYDARATTLRLIQMLNDFIDKNDPSAADREANMLRGLLPRPDIDAADLQTALTTYDRIKGRTAHVWPPGLKGEPFASNFGQDLYGYWMDIQNAGTTQRLRYIPPGSFAMGSGLDEWGRLPDEPILEPTTISQGFWMADAPVTQGLYEAVMGAPANHAAFNSSSTPADVRRLLPMENISYAHAVNFLSRLGLGARLPTEAEYEYALRAGSTYRVAGTGRLSDMAWFWDEAHHDKPPANPLTTSLDGALAPPTSDQSQIRILHELDTDTSDITRLVHPIKQKLPNAWGLFDMQGNVWEWCSGTSDNKPRDYHPARGGSWISIPQSCRAARDVWFSTEEQSWNLGMRFIIPAQ